MDYTEPNETGYTIYSKSGCKYCTMVKDFLKKENIEYTIVDCDEYLIENKASFVSFVNGYAGKDTGGFPKVFKGKEFIGSYKETKEHVVKTLLFEEDFDF